jgi:hypothetical protein
MIPALGGVLLAAVVVGVMLQGPATFTAPRILLPDVSVSAPPRDADSASGTPAPQEKPHITRIDLSWVALGIVVIALVIGIALLWRYLRRRLRLQTEQPAPGLATVTAGDLPDAPDEAPRPEAVRRGLDRAADALTDSRNPRDAIERAWLGLEEGAADSGVRRLPAETPGEFVARVLSRVGADPVAARGLLEVYLRVRFGDRPVTAGDVAVARAALEGVRSSWQGGTAEASAARPDADAAR